MIFRNSVAVKTFFPSIAKKIGYILAAGIITSAVLISTAHLLTPVLDKHRSRFEHWASRLLDTPVKIQKVAVSWYHYQPVISLNSVTILNKQTHEPVLEIQKVMVFFSLPKSLWQRKPIPSCIMVSGTDVHLHESSSGDIVLQGFPALGGFNEQPYKRETKISDALALLSIQPKLILRDIDVRYSDASGQKRFVTLYNLNIQNLNNQHTIVGRAILHQKIPTEVTLAIRWDGEQPDFASMDARIYLYVSGLSLAQWLKHSSWKNWRIEDGIGSAKIWANWQRGAFQKVQTVFQLYGLDLYSKTNKSIYKINRLSGHLGWVRDGQTQVFAGDDLIIDLPTHLWPVNQFYVSLTANKEGILVPKIINIGYVDLQDVQSFLSSSSVIPESSKQFLSKLHPQGKLQNIMLTFPPVWDDWQNIAFIADFNELGFSSWHTLPSMNNLSGKINWHYHSGDLSLDSRDVSFQYDSIFSNSITMDHISGVMHGEVTPNHEWLLHLQDFNMQNNDVTAQVNGSITVPQHASTVADLNANFNLQDARHITQYLPLKIFNTSLVTWLQEAFLSGEVKNAHAILQGPLQEFPFVKGNGTFLITGLVNNVDLYYAPNWPILQKINGQLTFKGDQMIVDADRAQIFDVPITHIHGEIPQMSHAMLKLKCDEIAMNFMQGIYFLHHSPLENTIGKIFTNIALTGPITLKLGLDVPLSTNDTTQVRGEIVMKNTLMNLIPWHLSISNLNGLLYFTESKIDAKHLQGQLFSKPIVLSLATVQKEKDTSIVRAKLKSQLNITDIENWLKIPLTKHMKGATDVKSVIDFSYKTPIEIHVSSNLVGATIDSPKEFAKTAQASRPFTADITVQEQKPLRVKLNYGDLAHAALVLTRKKEEFNLLSAHLQLGKGQASYPEEAGLFISGNFKNLNWNKMKGYLDQPDDTKLPDIPLRSIDVNAENLDIANLQFQNVHLKAIPDHQDWFVDMTSPDVIGRLQIPKHFTRDESLSAEFDKLKLRTANNEQQSLPTVNVKNLPAIHIVANGVSYNDLPIGYISLKASPSQNGMKIQSLKLSSSQLNLQASGDWTTTRTRLRGSADSAHISELLRSFGFSANNFISSEGGLHFDLNWPGALFAPSIASLNGRARLDLKSGRIIDVGEASGASMDVGRMLSIFSLQTIPRRLALDFSDLFQKGYSFDSVRADFTLKNGDAFTDNLRFEGPVAGVGIYGRIGLKAKDYDFTLSVSLYVGSAPSLPIAGTLALLVNPLGGIAALALGTVVGSAVSKVATYYYEVKGPWDNPTWEPVSSR